MVQISACASSGDAMTTLYRPRTKPAKETARIPPLENGDRLHQKTFHERYEAMPPDVRAELIEGIVYMASPQKLPHGLAHKGLLRWLDEYEEATPGTVGCIDTTVIAGSQSEPQPDAWLIILPEHGDQTWEDNEHYLHGAPELVGEISWASESIDLHAKKRDYEKAG